MLTSDFDYKLPLELIAQTPTEPREMARLMVVERERQSFKHSRFYELGNFLKPGDLLVWNNSKVFRARLFGEVLLDVASDDVDDEFEEEIKPTGKILNITKQVEIFLIRPVENIGVWRVLAKPAKKLRLGMKIRFAKGFECEVMFKEADGTVLVQFGEDDLAVRAKANEYGEVPVPPYITHPPGPPLGRGGSQKNEYLEERYQTVYAKHEGSVAAPTAGFHFSPELIEKLEKQGIQFAEVTLHVGLGTFLPVKTTNIEEHKMHSEYVEITDKNAELINAAKAEGRRVVAVGTTTVRVLEGVFLAQQGRGAVSAPLNQGGATPPLRPYNGDINIFITPGFKFQVVDALITNFHLPKSTLLMLVSAFANDRQFVLKCYEEAIRQKYRFYSFGDAMLII
ncbi:MAG: tRNA preQ1(34) S-adenosylmethionine ribosyltransferase-isomerase QueA [Candidatus Azambacteria bacterium]|nr:tRNA preQ1(34) S-adenosylmethionine ribosyltransferase-isomerase QueA [Candidatus Azambacteria bacterium]